MSNTTYHCEICSKSFPSLMSLCGHKSAHSEKFKNHITNLEKIKPNINLCKNCNKETNNPKFCSRSCSASHNNKGVRRHGQPPKSHFCLHCNNKLKPKRKYCSIKCQQTHQRNLRFQNGTMSTSTLKRYLIETKGH